MFENTHFENKFFFFCVIFLKRKSRQESPRLPLQWTYIIFKHLQTRLTIGTVCILFEWCGDPQALSLLYCKCPIDLPSEQWNGCCIGRNDLLAVTQWMLHILKVYFYLYLLVFLLKKRIIESIG